MTKRSRITPITQLISLGALYDPLKKVRAMCSPITAIKKLADQ
jgi:hypothetical protein